MRPQSDKSFLFTNFKTNKETNQPVSYIDLPGSESPYLHIAVNQRRGNQFTNTTEEQTNPKGNREITVLNVINQGKLLKHLR